MPRKSTATQAQANPDKATKAIRRVEVASQAKQTSAGSLTRAEILAAVGEALASHPLSSINLSVGGNEYQPTAEELAAIHNHFHSAALNGNAQTKTSGFVSGPGTLQSGPATSNMPATPINSAFDELHLQLQLLNADLGSMQEVLRPHLQSAVFDPAEDECFRDQTHRTHGGDMSPTLVGLNQALNSVERLRERIAFLTRNVVN